MARGVPPGGWRQYSLGAQRRGGGARTVVVIHYYLLGVALDELVARGEGLAEELPHRRRLGVIVVGLVPLLPVRWVRAVGGGCVGGVVKGR